jgi:hypothetical protein
VCDIPVWHTGVGNADRRERNAVRFDEHGHQQIDPQELDNYITGHYGEDQFNGSQEVSGEWYCPTCKAYISSSQVTFAEVHENCNTPVVWVEFNVSAEDIASALDAVKGIKNPSALPNAIEALKALVGNESAFEDDERFCKICGANLIVGQHFSDCAYAEARAALRALGGGGVLMHDLWGTGLTAEMVERDYHNMQTQKHKQRIAKHLPKGNKRNQPCPCGSGLKYKKCCLLKERED